MVEAIIQITNVWVLMSCRALQGVFVGIYMAMVPIYIHEVAPKQIVGSYGVFTQLFVVVALVVAYGLGLIFDANDV